MTVSQGLTVSWGLTISRRRHAKMSKNTVGSEPGSLPGASREPPRSIPGASREPPGSLPECLLGGILGFRLGDSFSRENTFKSAWKCAFSGSSRRAPGSLPGVFQEVPGQAHWRPPGRGLPGVTFVELSLNLCVNGPCREPSREPPGGSLGVSHMLSREPPGRLLGMSPGRPPGRPSGRLVTTIKLKSLCKRLWRELQGASWESPGICLGAVCEPPGWISGRLAGRPPG